jgi:hypothetical protein
MSLHYKQYKKLKKIINMKKSYKNKQQKIIKELFSLNIHKFYKSNLYKKEKLYKDTRGISQEVQRLVTQSL